MPAPAHEHVCLGYDDPTAFVSAARAFLVEGQRAGERVCLVAPSEARFELEGMEFVAAELAFPPGVVVDPAAVVADCAARTEAALAEGFAGYRVAADATRLVGTPEQLTAFARFEHLIDQYIAGHPYVAMCAYDRGVVGADTVAQVACLHPRSNGDQPMFRLYACASGRGSATVDGELDLNSHDLWPQVLERAEVPAVAGRLEFDASGLVFVDHNAVLAFAEHARRRGLVAVLRSAPTGTARLVELMGIESIRLEAAA
jgi:hypothetical protein